MEILQVNKHQVLTKWANQNISCNERFFFLNFFPVLIIRVAIVGWLGLLQYIRVKEGKG